MMKQHSDYIRNKNTIVRLSFLLILLIIIATFSYRWLLDVSFLDALYMTIITISTVGYKEVAVMTPEAKVFSIFLIILSFGTVAYMFSRVLSFLVEGDLKEEWGRKKMENKISKLEDHIIICGGGQTGSIIIKEFQMQGVPFVVIDNKEEIIENLNEEGINHIYGDATHENNLEKAMINKAKGLIATLSKDTDNLYLVLTARKMNEKLYIVSRAYDTTSNEKLILAGADNTVSPNEIGGKRIANIILNPSITTFIDTLIDSRDVFLNIEEICMNGNLPICGKLLGDVRIPEKTGLIILGIRKYVSGEFLFNPGQDEILAPGDTLVVLGQKEQVNNLRSLIGD